VKAPEPRHKAVWYLRKRWWAIGALALLIIIVITSSGPRTKNTSNTGGPTTTASSTPQTTGSTTTTTEEDDLGGPGAPTIAGTVVATGSGGSAGISACRTGSPLANVYHPNRLSVVRPCMTVSGTVESVRSEADGDTHFDLALDPQYSSLLRPANNSYQHGWLVAEIVPADKPGCSPGQPPRPPSGTYDYGAARGPTRQLPRSASTSLSRAPMSSTRTTEAGQRCTRCGL
jgi:hypothetical protein